MTTRTCNGSLSDLTVLVEDALAQELHFAIAMQLRHARYASNQGCVRILQIWSARFVSQEGGLRMWSDVGDGIEVGRSESAPLKRVDMTRSGSSLGIGNNAQLYLPPGPRGRRRDVSRG